MALLALRCSSLKALTSLGGLLRKLVTQTLLERYLAEAAAAAAASVLSPRSLCTNLMSKHSITSHRQPESHKLTRYYINMPWRAISNSTTKKTLFTATQGGFLRY